MRERKSEGDEREGVGRWKERNEVHVMRGTQDAIF